MKRILTLFVIFTLLALAFVAVNSQSMQKTLSIYLPLLANPQAVQEFALVQVNDKPLPINEGALPGRGDTNPQCNYILDKGYLRLYPNGNFDFYYQHINSCTSAILQRTQETGFYARQGQEVVFIVPYASGSQLTFKGFLQEKTLSMLYYDQKFLLVTP